MDYIRNRCIISGIAVVLLGLGMLIPVIGYIMTEDKNNNNDNDYQVQTDYDYSDDDDSQYIVIEE